MCINWVPPPLPPPLLETKGLGIAMEAGRVRVKRELSSGLVEGCDLPWGVEV